MADTTGKDQYQEVVIQGVSSVDNSTPTNVNVNPVTHATIVEVENSADIGGGTQYTEGNTDTSITGTAIMWEDASDTLRPVSTAKPLPVSASIDTTGLATDATDVSVASIDTKTPALGQALAAGSVPVVLPAAQITTLTPPAAITGFATSAKQDTIIGHVDGIEGLLTTIDTDTSNISTKIDTIAGAVSGTEVQVDVLTLPNVTVGAAIPAGTNNIGDVDVLTVPADPFGANADVAATAGSTGSIQAKLRLITSQLDSIKTAVETLDNVVGGSEAQVDIVGALPAGTNAIGKLAANSGVDIGDVTLTAGTAAIGTLLPPDIDITTHTNYAKKYYTNAGAVTDGIIWSPAAGKRWHVLTLYIQVSVAATVTLEDDKAGGDEAVWKGELAANSGVVLTFPEKYPFASGEDAADLLITTSAGNVYVTCVGYEV